MDNADYGDTVAGRFWMCLKTVHEMLYDRGYAISEMPSHEEIVRKLRFLDLADSEKSQTLMDQFEMCVHLRHNEQSHIRVFWLCGKIGVNSESMLKIQKMFPSTINIDLSENDDEDDAVQLAQAKKGIDVENPPDTIVLIQVENCTITPPARKIAAKIPAIVEIFDSADLRRNVTKHRLQPAFTVLSQAEIDELKKKYCVTNSQLPKMRWDDPIRRYFGLRVGQVIRSVRMADCGKEIYNRIVEPPTVSKKK